MDVSVVIPVFNATRFLEDAVASVMKQEAVKEILLIEDGSGDNSLQLCRQFAGRYPESIRVLQHTDGRNHGPSATRNLGMTSARCEYVAFLDADDIYLDDRFRETVNIFNSSHDADGVFETVDTLLEDHGLSNHITKRAGARYARVECSDPDHLLSYLAKAKGYIHLNGLTVRRDSIDRNLSFDPHLRQGQDTDFVLRLAATKKLYGGPSERIVALRRVHDANRVFDINEALHYRRMYLRKCALNGFYGVPEIGAKWAILNRMARASRLVSFARRWRLPVTPFRLLHITVFLATNPGVVVDLLQGKRSVPSLSNVTS